MNNCLRCGYDLSGRRADERCPECGASAADGPFHGAWRDDRARRWFVIGGWLIVATIAVNSAGSLLSLVVFLPNGLDSLHPVLLSAIAFLVRVDDFVALFPVVPLVLASRRLRIVAPLAVCTAIGAVVNVLLFARDSRWMDVSDGVVMVCFAVALPAALGRAWLPVLIAPPAGQRGLQRWLLLCSLVVTAGYGFNLAVVQAPDWLGPFFMSWGFIGVVSVLVNAGLLLQHILLLRGISRSERAWRAAMARAASQESAA